MATDVQIEQKESRGRGMFYVPDASGAKDFRAAMMYHRWGSAQTVNVDHTEVDESLRGQGVGERMLESLVAWAREEGVSVSATCPFAVAMFEKHGDLRDVLVEYGERR